MWINILHSIIINTVTQLSILFGFFLVLGYIHSHIHQLIYRYFSRVFGWAGVLITGIIGTPIHEISHWITAKIFRHRIESVSLFRPHKRSGKLGHVTHSYNSKSIYQTIGNFFIGASPLIAGSLIISTIFRFALPEQWALLGSISYTTLNTQEFISTIYTLLVSIYSHIDLGSWKFWMIAYIIFSIALHMAPSVADQKTMWKGFGHIAILLVAINTILKLLHISTTSLFPSIFPHILLLGLIIAFAIIVSTFYLVLMYLLYMVKRLIFGKY